MKEICPNCNHENEPGARYCSACGTELPIDGGKETIPFRRSEVGGIPTEQLDNNVLGEVGAAGDAVFALRFLNSNEVMPLPKSGDYILGRISEGQSILPDIDLSPYDAFEAGVSRLHALLSMSPKSISITDLGASNGTFVNTKSLQPYRETGVGDKDLIQLGKLNLQVIKLNDH